MGKIYLRQQIWYSDYWFAGRRIRKPLSKNKRDAQAMQDQISAASRYQKHGLIPQQLTWDFFKSQYLRFRKDERNIRTYQNDLLAIRRLEEAVHIRLISEVTPELLQWAKGKWKEKGYTESAIGSYVMAIKAAMKTAENWRYTQMHPWRMVKVYKSPGRLIYYTPDELKGLIGKTTGPWRTALLLMSRAGLRSGEVRHLEWGDIDWPNRLLHIRVKPFWKPKNSHARDVDLPEDLEKHLKSLRMAQGFVLGGGKPLDRGLYASYFTDLINRSGLRGSAHSFRHTYATHLISNGATLEEVGQLLGHKNPATTRIYAHLMPHARRRAVDRLPKFVSVPVSKL